MDVAAATSTVSRPLPVMTPRGSDAVETGAGTRTPTPATTASGGGTEPLVNRFPSIAFTYDTDASRLVMQYRDPANGKTVSQIPTEAALKQYKEAQQQEKDAERASLLKLTVGGDAQSGAQGATDGHASGAAAAASPASGLVSQGGGGGSAAGSTTIRTAGHAASVAVAASAGSAAVAHFAATTARPAGASVARVNVVI
ncbi:hypothetical protein [Azospirillum sp. TSO35-2]|uniref:hypothetical protein n=1 Tax=Azospirillum sp. TSO35-2 TaxID=716796 RepID=UPI0011B56F96|nr:hypothetical protein [Azospirillum sp. TSO35-2]